MINPHSWFHIDVKGPDGKVTTVDGRRRQPEPADPAWASRRTPCRSGRSSSIEGYQAKDGTKKAVGRNFVLADGKRLFLGGFSWRRLYPRR